MSPMLQISSKVIGFRNSQWDCSIKGPGCSPPIVASEIHQFLLLLTLFSNALSFSYSICFCSYPLLLSKVPILDGIEE